MGLFNFFKKREQPISIPPENSNDISLEIANNMETIQQDLNSIDNAEEYLVEAPITSQEETISDTSQQFTAKLTSRLEAKLSSFKSDLVKLVGCTGEDEQFTIGYMEKNDLLTIRRVKEKNEYRYKVFDYYGKGLGRIPAKYEELCQIHGVIAASFCESFLGSSAYYPIIRIFWDTPKDDNSPIFRVSKYKSKPSLRNKKPYVILDLETTGLKYLEDEIIEVGMLKIINGEIVDQYSTLVNPGIHIPLSASEINNIYDEDVLSAPPICDVIHTINDFIGESVIIGHNINFDLRFLKMAMVESGISKNISYIDTLSFSKSVVPDADNHKLETLMKIARIEDSQSHRALDDAINAYKVLKYLIEENNK